MSQALTQEFVDSCRVEDGFHLRGEAMTRTEVFVDAAFAFAVTMLVISIDQIPQSVPELIAVSKQIPAFVLSVIVLVWIWYTHSTWSKRFGLEDGKSVALSVTLLIIMLIYIYPLKMMFSGLFYWLSSGYLPSQFVLDSSEHLRYLFIYFGIGMTCVSLTFVAMFKQVLNKQAELLLTENEKYQVQTFVYIRCSMVVICCVGTISPLFVSEAFLPFTPFAYSLLGVSYPLIESYRNKNKTAA